MANKDDLADTEPLLPKPWGRDDTYEYTPDELKLRQYYLDVSVSIAVPWVCFTFLMLLFSYYHYLYFLVWWYIYSCIAAAIACVVVGAMARHGLLLLLGLNIAVSVLFGVSVGLYMDSEYLHYYNTVNGGKTYDNVDPSSPAHAHEDAGVVNFGNTTLVDNWRTIGYVYANHLYCVAPVGKETLYSNTVQYWATGKDCCQKRSQFNCGTAMDATGSSKGSIVAHKSDFWAKAVAEASSVYNLTSSPHAIFLDFVDNPSDAQDEIWSDAIFLALVADVFVLMATSLLVYGVWEAMPAAMTPVDGEAYIAYYASRIGPNLEKFANNRKKNMEDMNKKAQMGIARTRMSTGAMTGANPRSGQEV